MQLKQQRIIMEQTRTPLNAAQLDFLQLLGHFARLFVPLQMEK